MASISDRMADDWVDAQVRVLQSAEGISQRLLSELSAAEDEILATLRRTNLTQFTRQRTIELLNQVRRISTSFSKKAYTANRNDASAVAAAIAKRSARDMNDVFNVNIFSPSLSANSLKRILDDRAILGGQTLKDFWSRQPMYITDAYSKVIRTGLITGASKGDMVQQLSESAALAGVRGNIRTAVRTSVMEVANGARNEMFMDNLDLVKGLQWLATLDSRTSAICRGLDGLTWSLPDYEPVGHARPYPGSTAHANCRSTQIPWLRSFAELATKNKDLAAKLDDAMSEGTRASMDGQVSRDLRYDDWLRAQGEDKARDILGPTRFAAWNAGQLELRDMLDQSNNPLTVDELRNELEGTLSGVTPFADSWSDTTLLVKEGEELLKKLRKETKALVGASDSAVQQAYKQYTLRGFSRINTALRAGAPADGFVTVEMEQAKHINSVIDAATPLSKEYRVFRGLSKVTADDLGYKIGDTIADLGFTSTSVDPTIAMQFASSTSGAIEVKGAGVLFDIKLPPGTHAINGSMAFEKEMLLKSNSKFRVVGRTQKRVAYYENNSMGSAAAPNPLRWKLMDVYELEYIP